MGVLRTAADPIDWRLREYATGSEPGAGNAEYIAAGETGYRRSAETAVRAASSPAEAEGATAVHR
jgi:hypothetical protein